MKHFVFAFLFVLSFLASGQSAEIVKMRLYKSERKLVAIDKKGKIVKEFSVMLGREPVGAKQRQGDNKTPEGIYLLDYKNPNSKFYKSIHVNYPNKKDLLNAKIKGIRDPGNNIMIHGLPNDFGEHMLLLRTLGLESLADALIRQALPFIDWTQGCIAVVDKDMDVIYQIVNTPMPFFIYP